MSFLAITNYSTSPQLDRTQHVGRTVPPILMRSMWQTRIYSRRKKKRYYNLRFIGQKTEASRHNVASSWLVVRGRSNVSGKPAHIHLSECSSPTDPISSNSPLRRAWRWEWQRYNRLQTENHVAWVEDLALKWIILGTYLVQSTYTYSLPTICACEDIHVVWGLIEKNVLLNTFYECATVLSILYTYHSSS